jgi:hypothetical protein
MELEEISKSKMDEEEKEKKTTSENTENKQSGAQSSLLKFFIDNK